MTQTESFSQIGPTASLSQAHASLLSGGGEMGARVRAFDWASTPLGAVEQWPQALLTLVSTSIRSRFPIVIWWGREHYTMLYNDDYISFLGKTKHPGWLGRSGRDCWREIWPTIGPMLESVFETGQPTWSEDLLLVLDRNLPCEEGYFTFSYSAIMGEKGLVEGIFCACTETTARVLSERRLRTLRDLASRASEAREAVEACEIAARLLGTNEADMPFALIYLLDRDRTTAHLVAHSGLSASSRAAEASITLSSSTEEQVWPLAQVARQGESILVTDLMATFGTLPGGPWPESPDSALVLPLKAPEQNQVTGFLVVGISPRRILDEDYQDFCQMVAGHVATAVANARAYEEERRRAEALAELDRSKTLFFSNISHEFRTPLTLMLGPLEDLLSERSTFVDAHRESIELLQGNALRLLKLVNTLLDFSRIEAGRMQASYEMTDIVQYTADLVSNFRSIIEHAGLTLQLTLPFEPVYLCLDRAMWEKIVFNLLSNAFKFTWQGGIEVSLQDQDTAVQVQVRDSGVGIAAKDLPHIFERFHRVEGVHSRSIEGSGIGLALVAELVKLHHGTIAVASEQGQGTTLTITLPKGSEHLPHDWLSTGSEDHATARDAAPYLQEMRQWLDGRVPDQISPEVEVLDTVENWASRPRIVLADDNADMREYLKRLLTPHFEVEAVSNGRRALQAIATQTPDLVVTDVMMPELDGFQLLHALKTDPATARIPVILISARAGEEAVIEGVQKGADDYLVKPFSARELLARVTTQIKTARTRYEAEERLYDLFEQAPAAVVILRGPTYVVELANPTTLKIWGRNRQQVLGQPLFEALPEIRGQGLEPLLEGVLTTGKPYVGQELNIQLDRSESGRLEDTYLTFVYTPLRNARKDIEGIMVFAYDVTEQVRARAHIEELSRQKDDFISVASHELKTPVTSLKAYAQLLERRFRLSGDTRSADLLGKMDAQLNKLTSLVKDLLDVSKIENGQLRFQPSCFEMNELIAEVVEETQRTTTRHQIVRDLTAPVTLFADRDRIGQVLTNLLTNAIKYSPQTDTVVVKTVCTQDAIITSVQDFGIGIPTEKQSHLFERFYRVEGESQMTFPGLGLGLYVAAEFVKRHQGSIWVESEPERGTTISFALPLLSDEERCQ
jgi:PAS domain S-box-containing protein